MFKANDKYFTEGEKRAYSLGNRGKIKFDAAGNLSEEILNAYWRNGFYIFTDLLSVEEQLDLKSEFEALMKRAYESNFMTTHLSKGSEQTFKIDGCVFSLSKPLADPLGGQGRYEVRMQEHDIPNDAPSKIITNINRPFLCMTSFLRLYGHPELLKIAEAINGEDFTPFNESVWIKPAGLGTSTSWHQDGTTHWDNPKLDAGTHGFNFMAQLYTTNPINALWVVPGTHNIGKIDIKIRKVAGGGTDHFLDAVPMLCNPADVVISNRQVLHASFANLSKTPRVTLAFGFHRKISVLGVQKVGKEPYNEQRILDRAQIIPLAVEARRQKYPEELSYIYQPLSDESKHIRWNEKTKRTVLDRYWENNLSI